MNHENVTFSFGENWKAFLESMPAGALEDAIANISEWLSDADIRGREVCDVGSGSGLHSLAFLRLGARTVRSFDVDPKSVEATTELWRRAGEPANWVISHGSILDPEFVASLGTFEIVYSWGVLHHTGALWGALANASRLVGDSGRFWIAIYMSGPNYAKHLATKRRYNEASRMKKRVLEVATTARVAMGNAARGKSPLNWLPRKKSRGMAFVHDLRDWLGGLPYEVASPDEICRFGRERGLSLERIKTAPEGSCAVYLLSRSGVPARR